MHGQKNHAKPKRKKIVTFAKKEHLSMDFIDYYKILGVSRNASTIKILKAFKSKALRNHPDKAASEQKRKRPQKS